MQHTLFILILASSFVWTSCSKGSKEGIDLVGSGITSEMINLQNATVGQRNYYIRYEAEKYYDPVVTMISFMWQIHFLCRSWIDWQMAVF